MRLRAEHPVFRRRRFFTGQAERGGLPDIAWRSSDGTPMGEYDWFNDCNGQAACRPACVRCGERRPCAPCCARFARCGLGRSTRTST